MNMINDEIFAELDNGVSNEFIFRKIYIFENILRLFLNLRRELNDELDEELAWEVRAFI